MIYPVLKNGDPTEICNYRPIVISRYFAKLFKIIIYDIVYISIDKVISLNHFGFMSGRSTTANLICITQFISDILDRQRQVDIIYTDLQKAFDRLDLYILLSKLNKIGFSDSLLRLMSSYLIGRIIFLSNMRGFNQQITLPNPGCLKDPTWVHYYF